jgi:hypothetical protein
VPNLSRSIAKRWAKKVSSMGISMMVTHDQQPDQTTASNSASSRA